MRRYSLSLINDFEITNDFHINKFPKWYRCPLCGNPPNTHYFEGTILPIGGIAGFCSKKGCIYQKEAGMTKIAEDAYYYCNNIAIAKHIDEYINNYIIGYIY